MIRAILLSVISFTATTVFMMLLDGWPSGDIFIVALFGVILSCWFMVGWKNNFFDLHWWYKRYIIGKDATHIIVNNQKLRCIIENVATITVEGDKLPTISGLRSAINMNTDLKSNFACRLNMGFDSLSPEVRSVLAYTFSYFAGTGLYLDLHCYVFGFWLIWFVFRLLPRGGKDE